MDFFDEPDPNTRLENAVEPLDDNVIQNEFTNESYDSMATPINTMSFFDEPDPNNKSNVHLAVHQESSASPPPPSNTLSNVDNASATKL